MQLLTEKSAFGLVPTLVITRTKFKSEIVVISTSIILVTRLDVYSDTVPNKVNDIKIQFSDAYLHTGLTLSTISANNL